MSVRSVVIFGVVVVIFARDVVKNEAVVVKIAIHVGIVMKKLPA